MSDFKVLSWNMKGRESNWRWLVEDAEFDVALLQEAPYPTGYESNFVSIIHNGKRKKNWGTAIVSKKLKLSEYKNLSFGYWGYKLNSSLAVAQSGGERPIWFASMHCWHGVHEERDIKRNPINGLVRERANGLKEVSIIRHLLKEKFKGERFIAGGDLNTHRGLGDRAGDTFQLFSQMGFLDTRQKFYDEEQQTFFRQGGRPSQLDHVFTDEAGLASLTDWKVLTEVVEDLRLSDHAPIELTFQMNL